MRGRPQPAGRTCRADLRSGRGRPSGHDLEGGAAKGSEALAGSARGWQGRGVARAAGRQNWVTPAGSRVAQKDDGVAVWEGGAVKG